MPTHRHRLQFPPHQAHTLHQDEVYFNLIEENETHQVRFHDYDKIYLRPGLYEQLFYERLKCTSPTKVTQLLEAALRAQWENISELRVLDLGAGNGMMGEELKKHGVARLVGADIIQEAKEATYRDRPSVYDDYYVEDFTQLTEGTIEHLQEWQFDCLTSVAALGFGDIPPKAFFQAMQLIKPTGWCAFNIKVTFLEESDNTGFSRFIRELIFSDYLEVHNLERYRHRYSMEGTPLFYYALVARKTAEIPADFLDKHNITD